MKDMKNHTDLTELHDMMTLAINHLTHLSKLDNGKQLLLLTDQSTIGLQDDDHARFTWVITENITSNEDEADKEMDLTNKLYKDFQTLLDKMLDKYSWTKLDAPNSPAAFYTTDCGDTLVLTMTDRRLIINLTYSGMY